eukprot:5293300-Pleurochrysis_carterae.AAC.1
MPWPPVCAPRASGMETNQVPLEAVCCDVTPSSVPSKERSATTPAREREREKKSVRGRGREG